MMDIEWFTVHSMNLICKDLNPRLNTNAQMSYRNMFKCTYLCSS